MLTMTQVKEMLKSAKGLTAEIIGSEFEAPTGARGRVLAQLSEHGKVQAEMTCTETVDGILCMQTHVREQSDWHQCGKCVDHSKGRSKKTGGTGASASTNVLRKLKVLDTDSPETKAKKEEANALIDLVLAEEKKVKDAEKAQNAEVRKKEQEEAKAKKDAEKAEAIRRQVAERWQAIQAVAKEKGVPVSAKTVAEVEAA